MRRWRFWLIFGLLVVVGGALIILPASPLYFAKIMAPRLKFNGKSALEWQSELADADGDDEKRIMAIHALGTLGTDASFTIPELSKILGQDPNFKVRRAAAMALSKMNPNSKEALPTLEKALFDEELSVRLNAALAILRLETDGKPAAKGLIEGLKDKTNNTNLSIYHFTITELMVLALGKATSGSTDGVEPILEVLKNAKSDSLRQAAARALGNIGPQAESAVPQLRELLGDKKYETRDFSAEALEKIIGERPKIKGREPLKKAELAPDLPEADRAYIWDVEHHGNLLGKFGFARLAQSIKKGDRQSLKDCLAKNFVGADIAGGKRFDCATAVLHVQQEQDHGESPEKIDADKFIDRLLKFRSLFAEAPGVSIATKLLSPQQRGNLTGKWEGVGQVRMHGQESKGKPVEVVLLFRFEIPTISKETLEQPGWLGAARFLQKSVAKSSFNLFEDVTKDKGLKIQSLHDNWKSKVFISTPGGVFVCDFNRDGILDMLVTDINGHALYQGTSNQKFIDVTQQVGLEVKIRGKPTAAWIDIDGDGWEDLVLGDKIYRNDRGERFLDYTKKTKLDLPLDHGNMAIADFNKDGKLDIYVTRDAHRGGVSWLENISGDSKGNYLFQNLGNWEFEEVTQKTNTLGGYRSTFTSAWLDANNDGWPDLHVINEFGDGVLLINNQKGAFTEHRLATRPADYGSMGLAVGDINNDGNIDLYCANMYSKAGTRIISNLPPNIFSKSIMEKIQRFVAGSQLHLNHGNLQFSQEGKAMMVDTVGWAYGPTLADFDNDGFLDIYANAGYASKERSEPDG